MSSGARAAVLVRPEATYPLRREVLGRSPTPEEITGDLESWGHYAVIADGAIVATGLTHPQPPPATVGNPPDAWRIIGMAVDEAHRRQGLGGLVLAALLAHASSRAGRYIWCNARTGAVSFYRRHGFVQHPSELTDSSQPRLLMGRHL